MAKQHDQGVGGVHSVKRNGSNTEQGVGGVLSKGASIPQKGGKIPANVPTPSESGSHTKPTVTQGERSGVRGGGGLKGHDRTTPGPEAGSKETQQPGLQGRNTRKKHNYLGG